MNATYSIPEYNLDTLTAKVNELNKRAVKLNLPLITVTVGERTEVPYKDDKKRDRVRVMYSVTLDGADPVLEGWRFLATLDHASDVGVVLRAVPGVELPVSYRTALPICNHCGLERNRHETFVLLHEDGRETQVGRSCLKDFLGHKDPHVVANWCTHLWNLGELATRLSSDEDEEGDSGPRASRYEYTTAVLSLASATIAECGWVSRAAEREHDMRSTSSEVENQLFNRQLKEEHRIKVEDRHVAEGKAAREWVLSLAEKAEAEGKVVSDYEHNLIIALTGDVFPLKWLVIVVSAVATYKRNLGQEIIRRAAKRDSKHFGEIGKRSTWTLQFVSEYTSEGAYGITHIYRFVSAEGNQATWFSSRDCGLKQGAWYTVKGSVKAHGDYKGIAQTTLTRCVCDAVEVAV